MLVRDVMSRHVNAVAPDDSAWTAAEKLTELDLTGLPVADADRYVQGVVTELDLIHAVQRGADLQRTRVDEVMHARPLYVEPDASLDAVVALMDEWQIRRLPVCEHSRLVGVISRGDILHGLLRDHVS